MNEKLIYKINNKEYLLLECLITDEEDNYRFNKAIRKIKAIEQGIKEISRSGILKKGYIIMKVLVPTNKMDEWYTAWEDV